MVSDGAEVNTTIAQTWKDKDGWTYQMELPPISIAAIAGRLDLLVALIDAGSEIDKPDSHYGGSALLFGAYHGHVEVVGSLLDNGAAINFSSGDCTRALHEAALCKHVRVVQLLLDRGADLTVVNDCLMTPLHEAVKPATVYGTDLSEKEAIEARKKQATISARVVKVMLESLKGKPAVLLELLEKEDKWGVTALIYALRSGNLPAVKLLLKAGANPRATAKSGGVKEKHSDPSSALSWAVGAGELEVVQLMVKTDARHDINHAGEGGVQPLAEAACISLDIAVLLLKNGADVHGKDNDGNTALHHTVMRYSKHNTRLATKKIIVKTVAVLLQHGANVNAENNEGKTASEYDPKKVMKGITNVHLGVVSSAAAAAATGSGSGGSGWIGGNLGGGAATATATATAATAAAAATAASHGAGFDHDAQLCWVCQNEDITHGIAHVKEEEDTEPRVCRGFCWKCARQAKKKKRCPMCSAQILSLAEIS